MFWNYAYDAVTMKQSFRDITLGPEEKYSLVSKNHTFQQLKAYCLNESEACTMLYSRYEVENTLLHFQILKRFLT